MALMALVVVGGFFLQLNWMQRAKREGAVDMAPNALADKLGQWMLEKRGGESRASEASATVAPGVETKKCFNCQGMGYIFTADGQREICPICQGVGSHLVRYLDSADELCPGCAGMGRAVLSDTGEVGTCPRCGGRGLIRPATEPVPEPQN